MPINLAQSRLQGKSKYFEKFIAKKAALWEIGCVKSTSKTTNSIQKPLLWFSVTVQASQLESAMDLPGWSHCGPEFDKQVLWYPWIAQFPKDLFQGSQSARGCKTDRPLRITGPGFERGEKMSIFTAQFAAKHLFHNQPTREANMTTKEQMIEALRRFISQRSGIDYRNYDCGDWKQTRECFNGDYRPMLKHGRQAKAMLVAVALCDGISADDLKEADDCSLSSVTARLLWIIAPGNISRLNTGQQRALCLLRLCGRISAS